MDFTIVTNPDWICLEGLDGTGKSSVASIVSKALGATLVRLPNDTSLRERFLFDKTLPPKSRYYMILADTSLALSKIQQDKKVVFDRGPLSVFVYQSEIQIEEATVSAWNNCFPKWTFVLTAPVETCLQRASEKRGESVDVWEASNVKVWKRRAQKYLKLAEDFGYPVIDTSVLDVGQVAQTIIDRVTNNV